jgi:hypothetical protein
MPPSAVLLPTLIALAWGVDFVAGQYTVVSGGPNGIGEPNSQQQYYPLPSEQAPDPSSGYDEQYAQLLLGLSAGAYAVSPTQCIQRLFPATFNAVLYRNVTEKCDEVDSLCSFYITVSDVRREIIVVFRGTRNEVQLLAEGLSSLNGGVEFFGAGKVRGWMDGF